MYRPGEEKLCGSINLQCFVPNADVSMLVTVQICRHIFCSPTLYILANICTQIQSTNYTVIFAKYLLMGASLFWPLKKTNEEI